MLNLFLLTRLLDIATTSYGYYVLKLNELNKVNLFFLKQGLLSFFIYQITLTLAIFFLAKKIRLLYYSIVLFTILSLFTVLLNTILIIHNLEWR